MEPNIWCNLSEDLLEKVLAKLPLIWILRMRYVCKRWDQIIRSRHFRQLSCMNPSKKPCLVFHVSIGRSEVLGVYEPTFDKWYAISLSFLPPCADVTLVASAGGLLCFRTRKMGGVVYLVCNPITKTCKELPSPLHYRSVCRIPSMHALVVDHSSRSFKVIVAGYSSGKDSTTEVYDSKTYAWKLVGNLPLRRDAKTPVFQLYSGKPFCKGFLYCRACFPPGVMAYSVQEEVWIKPQATIDSAVLTPYLVEHGGCAMMVGGVRKAGGREFNPESFCIWQLDQSAKSWKEVTRMPEETCKKFLQLIEFDRFRSIGEGDLTYFTSADASAALMYDFSRSAWKWLPECNLQVGRHQLKSIVRYTHGLDCVFTFEPSLATFM